MLCVPPILRPEPHRISRGLVTTLSDLSAAPTTMSVGRVDPGRIGTMSERDTATRGRAVTGRARGDPTAGTKAFTYADAVAQAGDEDDVAPRRTRPRHRRRRPRSRLRGPARRHRCARRAGRPRTATADRPAGIFIPKWLGLVAAAIVAALIFGGIGYAIGDSSDSGTTQNASNVFPNGNGTPMAARRSRSGTACSRSASSWSGTVADGVADAAEDERGDDRSRDEAEPLCGGRMPAGRSAIVDAGSSRRGGHTCNRPQDATGAAAGARLSGTSAGATSSRSRPVGERLGLHVRLRSGGTWARRVRWLAFGLAVSRRSWFRSSRGSTLPTLMVVGNG